MHVSLSVIWHHVIGFFSWRHPAFLLYQKLSVRAVEHLPRAVLYVRRYMYWSFRVKSTLDPRMHYLDQLRSLLPILSFQDKCPFFALSKLSSGACTSSLEECKYLQSMLRCSTLLYLIVHTFDGIMDGVDCGVRYPVFFVSRVRRRQGLSSRGGRGLWRQRRICRPGGGNAPDGVDGLQVDGGTFLHSTDEVRLRLVVVP